MQRLSTNLKPVFSCIENLRRVQMVEKLEVVVVAIDICNVYKYKQIKNK